MRPAPSLVLQLPKRAGVKVDGSQRNAFTEESSPQEGLDYKIIPTPSSVAISTTAPFSRNVEKLHLATKQVALFPPPYREDIYMPLSPLTTALPLQCMPGGASSHRELASSLAWQWSQEQTPGGARLLQRTPARGSGRTRTRQQRAGRAGRAPKRGATQGCAHTFSPPSARL